MKLKLERRGVKAEIIHLFSDDGSTKIIMQDEYGFDTKKILNSLKKE